MVVGIISSVLIAVIGYLAQIAVFPAFGAIAVSPNMILAISVVFGMIYGPWPALAMGFFGGIMVDFMAGGAIGISSFIPVIAGFMLGMFRRELNSTHFAWAMIFAAFAHLINDFWMMLTMYFARVDVFIGWGTFLRSMLSAGETAFFAGLIFLAVTKILSMNERRSGLPYLQRY
jgi:rod shape-determining protein MreD